MHSPLLTAVLKSCNSYADKTALVSGSQSVTYGQLKEMVFKAASFLKSEGLSKGDRIALSARKELDFVYLYFAAHLLGIENVVVDSESNAKKLDYMMGLTCPKALFGFAWKDVPSFSYENLDFSPLEASEPEEAVDKEDIADIIFTTGTTGTPKGVCLSHWNIYSSAMNINGFIGNSDSDVEVLGLPLCHSFGLGRLRCTLIAGGTIVLLGSYANIKQFFSALETYNATGFAMVPSVWAYIRKFSGTRIGKYAPQIKYIEIGSAAMPLESKQELCSLFPSTRICMHYGLTEASRAAFMEFHQNKDCLQTIGRPVSKEVDIKIMDESGNPLPKLQTGEICVSGNMVMRTYFRPEENAGAFWGTYFRTGDMGYEGEDCNLYLVSRIKEIINVGGKKVSPSEVEDAIISLGVEDCICVGVADPSGILGEVPKAYILKGSALSFEDIRKGLASELENYKIPAFFEWIDEIPKTASGKKQRLSLKQS
jgi:long-chain acyl-CoA synthetase